LTFDLIGDFKNMPDVTNILTSYAWRIAAAVVIVLVGILTASLLSRFLNNLMKKTHIPSSTRGFITSFLFVVIIIFAMITGVAQFEIDIGPLVVGLAIIGFVVGLAMQGALSNLAAGIMILAQKPFQVGDMVEIAGEYGEVKEITMTSIILDKPENVKLIFPNSKVLAGAIKNYSSHRTRKISIDLEFAASKKINDIIENINFVIKHEEGVLKEPAPSIEVIEISLASVKLKVSVWCERNEVETLPPSLLKAIKTSLEKN